MQGCLLRHGTCCNSNVRATGMDKKHVQLQCALQVVCADKHVQILRLLTVSGLAPKETVPKSHPTRPKDENGSPSHRVWDNLWNIAFILGLPKASQPTMPFPSQALPSIVWIGFGIKALPQALSLRHSPVWPTNPDGRQIQALGIRRGDPKKHMGVPKKFGAEKTHGRPNKNRGPKNTWASKKKTGHSEDGTWLPTKRNTTVRLGIPGLTRVVLQHLHLTGAREKHGMLSQWV